MAKAKLASAEVNQEKFLVAYVRTNCNIYRSAKAAGISKQTHYNWLKSDPTWQGRLDDAKQEAIAEAQTTLYEMAIDRNFMAVIAFLRAEMPQKYLPVHETKMSGQIDHAITVQVIQDDNWYGNKNRLPPETIEPPTADIALPGTIQGSGLRPAVGQNGHGLTNGHAGPRSDEGAA